MNLEEDLEEVLDRDGGLLWLGREHTMIRHWREETKAELTGFSSARLVSRTEAPRALVPLVATR